jgi:kanamycin kinase
MIAAAPRHVELPERVAELIAGRSYRPVWRGELGSLTFEVHEGGIRTFLKWAPAGSGLDLAREAERLAWAGKFAIVPTVLDQGADDAGQWLVTAGLPGENAVTEQWRAQPRVAVTAIAQGLRRLHDTLPVTSCPFRWDTADRLAAARERGHLAHPAQWHPDHAHLEPQTAIALLANAPEIDEPVVCHGDACAPNTLIDDDGAFAGHTDLGALGVADRWADLAIGSWSLEWNYGPGWQDLFFEAYGVTPDVDRIAYYRLLWDVSP